MVLLFACRHGKCYKKSHQTRANDESTNKQPHPSRTECAKLLQFMQISLISLVNQFSSDANHDTMHDKIQGEHCHVLEICMPSNPHITKPCSTWQVLCMGIHKNNGQREPMNSKWIAVGNEWNECCWSTRSTTPATAQRGHLATRLWLRRSFPVSVVFVVSVVCLPAASGAFTVFTVFISRSKRTSCRDLMAELQRLGWSISWSL